MDSKPMQFLAMSMAWAGFIFTLLANFYCTFTVQNVSTEVTLQQNTSNNTIGPYYAGLWNYRTYEVLWTQNGDVIEVQTFSKCAAYPDGTETDAKWKTAQAFSIIATVLGGLAAIAMTSAACDSPTGYWKSYVGLLLLICLSEGLALIFLNSKACDSQEINLNTQMSNTTLPFDLVGTLSACKISSGGILAACAVCVWFLAALISGAAAKGVGESREAPAQDVEAAEAKRGDVKDEVEVVEQAPEIATS